MRDYFDHYTVNHSGNIDKVEAILRWFKNPSNPEGCQHTNDVESMFGQLKQWKAGNRKEMGKSEEMGKFNFCLKQCRHNLFFTSDYSSKVHHIFRNWCAVWLIWKNLSPKDRYGIMFTYFFILHDSVFRGM